MFNSLVKNISNIFGNKSDRDVKGVQPMVDAINQHFESYNSLSLDEKQMNSNKELQTIWLRLILS